MHGERKYALKAFVMTFRAWLGILNVKTLKFACEDKNYLVTDYLY